MMVFCSDNAAFGESVDVQLLGQSCILAPTSVGRRNAVTGLYTVMFGVAYKHMRSSWFEQSPIGREW